MNRRRSIMLPASTTLNGVTAGVPIQVFEDQIIAISTDNGNPANVNILAQFGNNANAATAVVNCTSAPQALAYVQQIRNFLGSDGFGAPFTPIIPVTVPTFSSVSPATCHPHDLISPALMGTGFALSGINLIKLDDGAGDVFIFNIQIVDDNNITSTNSTELVVAAVFTVFYSTNNGGSYTTTGLTVTCS